MHPIFIVRDLDFPSKFERNEVNTSFKSFFTLIVIPPPSSSPPCVNSINTAKPAMNNMRMGTTCILGFAVLAFVDFCNFLTPFPPGPNCPQHWIPQKMFPSPPILNQNLKDQKSTSMVPPSHDHSLQVLLSAFQLFTILCYTVSVSLTPLP